MTWKFHFHENWYILFNTRVVKNRLQLNVINQNANYLCYLIQDEWLSIRMFFQRGYHVQLSEVKECYKKAWLFQIFQVVKQVCWILNRFFLQKVSGKKMPVKSMVVLEDWKSNVNWGLGFDWNWWQLEKVKKVILILKHSWVDVISLHQTDLHWKITKGYNRFKWKVLTRKLLHKRNISWKVTENFSLGLKYPSILRRW